MRSGDRKERSVRHFARVDHIETRECLSKRILSENRALGSKISGTAVAGVSEQIGYMTVSRLRDELDSLVTYTPENVMVLISAEVLVDRDDMPGPRRIRKHKAV